jgi:hypothetical protein
LRVSPDASESGVREPLIVPTHVEIEMPNRASAFELEDELRFLHPLAIGSHGSWHIELADEGSHLDAIAEAAQLLVRARDLDGLVLRVHVLPEEDRP